MNTDTLKKLIKEAVKQAIREEFKQILAEHAASQLVYGQRPIVEQLTPQSSRMYQPANKQKLQEVFGNKPVTATPVIPTQPVNDFSSFLLDTAQNLTPQDIAGINNHNGG